MKPTSGLILLDVSDERAYVAEYLAHRGYRVQIGDWTSSSVSPLIVVTDATLTEALPKAVCNGIEQGRIGIVGLGVERDVDVSLAVDARGREVATAIDLVAQIVALRLQNQQDQLECQRWIDLALVDALTGLPNRRSWQAEIGRRCEGDKSLCVGLIDVDFFKRVNEQDGHSVGDVVLREVAIALRSRLRKGDFVARLGGDEFGVLLSGVTAQDAQQIIERVRASVSRHLAVRDLPPNTLSAGFVAVSSPSASDVDELYAAASRSLQQAKQQDRNCTVASAASWNEESRSLS